MNGWALSGSLKANHHWQSGGSYPVQINPYTGLNKGLASLCYHVHTFQSSDNRSIIYCDPSESSATSGSYTGMKTQGGYSAFASFGGFRTTGDPHYSGSVTVGYTALKQMTTDQCGMVEIQLLKKPEILKDVPFYFCNPALGYYPGISFDPDSGSILQQQAVENVSPVEGTYLDVKWNKTAENITYYTWSESTTVNGSITGLIFDSTPIRMYIHLKNTSDESQVIGIGSDISLGSIYRTFLSIATNEHKFTDEEIAAMKNEFDLCIGIKCKVISLEEYNNA